MKVKLFTLLIFFCPAKIFGQFIFKTLATPSTNTLLGISFADTSVGYACGDGGLIIKTIDGGSNWSLLSTGIVQNLWDIKVIPKSNGKKVIAVGEDNTVIKSMDGGVTWKSQVIPFLAGSFVFGIQCLDSLNYFACGGDYGTFSGAVLRTKDGGATWTSTNVPGSIFLDKLFMLDTAKGFAVGTNKTFEDGSIQKGVSGVYSASKISTDIITNLCCIDTNNIIAVGVAGQIWKSTDGGMNWKDKSYGINHLYGVQFRSPKTGFACGGNNTANEILYTNDSGNTWVQIPYSFAGILNSMCIVGDKVFMAGESGRVIKADLPSLSAIPNEGKEKGEVSIFPNPAKDKVYVKAATSAIGSDFRLFDAFGKIILETGIGARVEELNVQHLPSGTYVYSIEKGGLPSGSGKIEIIK